MNTKKRDSYAHAQREELTIAAPDAPLYERLEVEANKIAHIGPAKRAVALLREAADVLRQRALFPVEPPTTPVGPVGVGPVEP